MSYDSGPEWQEPDGTMHRRVGQGLGPQDDEPTRSRSGHTQQQPQFGYQPPQPPKPKHTFRNIALGVLGVIVVCIIIGAATSNGSGAGNATTASPATSAAAQDPDVQDSATADTGYTAIPIYSQPEDPATSAAPVVDVEQVTFKCTGSAPDGVDITYGGEGTQDSASHLPFKKTVPLSESPQYYAVQAQLDGGGKVTCTTTVEYDGTSTTQTGEASGGYNIASAEVCEDFEGGWDAC